MTTDLKNTDHQDRLFNAIENGVRLLLLAAALLGIVRLDLLMVVASLSILSLTFIPDLINKHFKLPPPAELRAFWAVFFFASLFLGGFLEFYTHYQWWDLPLHFSSGVGLSLTAFLFLHVFYVKRKLAIVPALMAVTTFCFAVTIGSLWEVFEFAADTLFDTTMQPSNADTMKDIIANVGGAVLGSGVIYHHLRTGRTYLISGMMARFYHLLYKS